MIKQYAQMIKDKEMTPKQAGQSFVMEEIRSQVEEWKREGIDNASQKTTLTSITYLNDDYTGGQTYYEDGTIFKPKKGRGLFFNGQYHKHGVKPVSKNIRYVVAAWYKKIQLNPSF